MWTLRSRSSLSKSCANSYSSRLSVNCRSRSTSSYSYQSCSDINDDELLEGREDDDDEELPPSTGGHWSKGTRHWASFELSENDCTCWYPVPDDGASRCPLFNVIISEGDETNETFDWLERQISCWIRCLPHDADSMARQDPHEWSKLPVQCFHVDHFIRSFVSAWWRRDRICEFLTGEIRQMSHCFFRSGC